MKSHAECLTLRIKRMKYINYLLSHANVSSDFDECQHDVCMMNSRCVNTDGSYTCICNEGYGMIENICLGTFMVVTNKVLFNYTNCNTNYGIAYLSVFMCYSRIEGVCVGMTNPLLCQNARLYLRSPFNSLSQLVCETSGNYLHVYQLELCLISFEYQLIISYTS